MDVDHISTLDMTDDATDPDVYQRALAANNLTLAMIARGAPLAQTLASIVNGIEQQYADVFGAIFMLDADGTYMHLGAGPSLHHDYRHAIGASATELGAEVHRLAADIMPVTFRHIEACASWNRFRDLALQHALYTSFAIPVLSADNQLLGLFVAYSGQHGQPAKRLGQSIADIAPLASIAIERHHAEARLRKAENTRRENETRLALAIEGSGTGIWDRNIPTGEIHYSACWKRILGYDEAEISNWIEDSYTRVHPQDLGYVQAAIQSHFEQETDTYAVEHRIRCKDGSYKWISSRGKVVSREPGGKPLRMIGTTTDITALRAMSEKLQQSVDLITCLTNEVPGLVYQYQLAPDGRASFTYVSDGIADVYELTPEELMADAALVEARIHPDDLYGYRESLAASAKMQRPWQLEYRTVLPRQGVCWRHVDARPSLLEDGGLQWHGFITDINERKRSEIELNEFATIDFLTQLPNRRYFMARMDEELVHLRSTAGISSAVLMYDLDHFKLINDSYGHAIGDLVLKHFAEVLRMGLRKSDTVGRIGGEEFAAVLPGAGFIGANIFAQRVQKLLAATPLVISDASITVTVSIGIAIMTAADASIDAALSRSDMALYRAKESGRNRIEMIEI